MSKIELSLIIKQEAPKQIKSEYKHVDLCKKLEQYIDDINSNFTESYRQWQYLKRVYEVLSKKPKLTSEEHEILSAVAPEIEKHGNGSELDSEFMHKHLSE